MNESTVLIARRLIFAAFALLALSTLITTYNVLRPGPVGGGFNNTIVQLWLVSLSTLFAAAGWWYLSQWRPVDAAQRSLLAKAYVLLGLQFSSALVARIVMSNGVTFINRMSAPYWITVFAFAVGAVGFFVTAFSNRSADVAQTDS